MVSRIVEAVYEKGVLRPIKPLSLVEHEIGPKFECLTLSLQHLCNNEPG